MMEAEASGLQTLGLDKKVKRRGPRTPPSPGFMNDSSLAQMATQRQMLGTPPLEEEEEIQKRMVTK